MDTWSNMRTVQPGGERGKSQPIALLRAQKAIAVPTLVLTQALGPLGHRKSATPRSGRG